MGTLKEDIKVQAYWIVSAFAADKLRLDFTLDSFMEIDRFFYRNMEDGKPKKGGRLAKKGYGPVLFSIGAYIGQTLIKNVSGSRWIIDEEDPEGELKIAVKLPDGTEVWPVQRVMKRFAGGEEGAIYPYGHAIVNVYVPQDFNEKFWGITKEEMKPAKPWWKIW